MSTADAIVRTLESPNVPDRNGECANIVDAVDHLAQRVRQVAHAITPLDASPGLGRLFDRGRDGADGGDARNCRLDKSRGRQYGKEPDMTPEERAAQIEKYFDSYVDYPTNFPTEEVAAAIREAVAEEREAAAALCESSNQSAGYVLAALIRARSQI